MAALALESAVLLSSGFDVLLVWRVAAPASYETVDWLDGYTAGKWFTVAGQSSVRHAGTCKFIAGDGTLEWQTRLRLGSPIVYGTSSCALSIEAGMLTDKHGNANAAVTLAAIDVTRTLVDSTGFLDQSITPGTGGVTGFVDPVDGSDSRTYAQMIAANAATPVKTINKAQDLLIANSKDDKGSHIKVIEGKADTRDHTAAYTTIRCYGPTPDKPFLITPCSITGGVPTTRATIRLSNGGVNNGYLAGFVREFGNPTDTTNVCINGFDILNTDNTGTAGGAGFDMLGKSTNLTIMDCRIQRTLGGLAVQCHSEYFTLHRCVTMDTVGVLSERPMGMYADFIRKGGAISDCHFDRCARKTTDLVGGDNQCRNIYVAKYGELLSDPVGPPTGPWCLTNSFQLRGQDTTVQLRTGHGSGVVFHKCPGAGFSGGPGGAGWNMTAQLESGDFIETNLSHTPCGQGVYINNSIRDYAEQLSSNECSKGGILEANVMYPEVGSASFRGRAIGVMGSNYTEKHDYTMRKNTVKGVGPVFINSETAYLLGNVFGTSNIIDSRGANNQLALYFEYNYSGVGYAFITRGNNVYLNDTSSALVYVAGANNSLVAYQGIVGTDSTSTSTAATYPDSSRTLASWAALKGLTDEAGFYAAVRDRAYRTWHAAFDAYAAVEYFQAGLDAFGSTWFNTVAGSPVGIPTERFGDAPAATYAPRIKRAHRTNRVER